MRPLPLLLLAAITAAAVYATYTVLTRPPATPALEAGLPRPLFPDLAAKINGVVQLVVTSHERSVTVERASPDSEQWTVKDKAGYPAAADLIKKTVVGLTDLRAIEPRTADPTKYDRLGVDEPEQAASTALRLSVRAAAGAELAALIRGKIATRGGAELMDSFYVRKVGEAQSWLAEGRLDPSADPVRWVDKDLPKLTPLRVMSVTVERPGADRTEITKAAPDDPDYTLAPLPAGTKAKSIELNRLAGALEFLSFDDVAKLDPAWFAESVQTTFRSFDGLVLSVRSVRHDGKAWIAFQASLDPEQAAKTKPASEDGKPHLSLVDVEQQVAAIQARHAAWAYQVSDYAADAFAPKSDNLVTKEGG